MIKSLRRILQRGPTISVIEHWREGEDTHYNFAYGTETYHAVVGMEQRAHGNVNVYGLERISGTQAEILIREYENGTEELLCKPESQELETLLRKFINYLGDTT